MSAATYEYVAENGDPLYTVKRSADKRFAQVPASGKTGPGAMNGVRRVLYRLPALCSAIERRDDQIFVCEGEKAAEALVEFGYAATTIAGGSNAAWLDEYTEALRGALLVRVIADRDEPGEKHAEKIRHALDSAGIPVVVEQSATLDKGDDIVEHLAAGYGLRDLVALEAREDGGLWQPVDLVTAGSVPPEPPTIVSLFYAATAHLLSGPPSAGKTMLVLCAMSAELLAGNRVMLVDLDRMGATDVYERLRGLGVGDQQLREQFVYLNDDRTPDDAALARIAHIAATCSLVAIDAFDPALGLFALDPNVSSDVNKLMTRLIDPLTRRGPAVVLLDHVTKDKEARGMYAAGSQRKTSATIVHIGMEAVGAGFARGTVGRSKVTIHRDRRGFNKKGVFGHLVIEEGAGSIAFNITPAPISSDGVPFRPTALMEAVSRFVEHAAEAPSKAVIEAGVGGNATATRMAMGRLVAEGFLRCEKGRHGATLHLHVAAYRQTEDPLSDRFDSNLVHLVQPRPSSSETRFPTTSSTSSTPLRGDEDGRGRAGGENEPTSSSTFAARFVELADAEELS